MLPCASSVLGPCTLAAVVPQSILATYDRVRALCTQLHLNFSRCGDLLSVKPYFCLLNCLPKEGQIFRDHTTGHTGRLANSTFLVKAQIGVAWKRIFTPACGTGAKRSCGPASITSCLHSPLVVRNARDATRTQRQVGHTHPPSSHIVRVNMSYCILSSQ